MKIVLTGGGTGGHITPILAVAHELKRLQPDARVIYIGERKGRYAHMMADNQDIDETYTIFAGKFRRYHGESWLKRLVAVKDHLYNLRDAFYVLFGIVQSFFLLRRIKPAVVFQKGGFVGLPVGIAAAARKIALVTHDSDILPGLANRVVSRWARYNATGMPAEYYRYPAEKVRHVGVLVHKDYEPVTTALRKRYREALGLPIEGRVLFVTGGSNGAKVLNEAMATFVPEMLKKHHDVSVLHQVGKGNLDSYGGFEHHRLHVEEFLSGMHRYSGAADVIVTRAGANTLAEFGVQGRACIVVPNPLLTGGHQIKNGEYLLQQEAAMVLSEAAVLKRPESLGEAVETLLQDTRRQEELAAKLQAITIPDATHRLALLLLEAAR